MAFGGVNAVIHALDSSKQSSGSVLLSPVSPRQVKYKVEHACRVTERDQPKRALCVEHGVRLSRELRLPLIVVREDWTPGGWGSFKSVLGMGAGWGLWLAELYRNDLNKFFTVLPQTWRAGLFGKGRPKDSEELKTHAIEYIHARCGLRVGHDVAEAACVGLFGAQMDEVHAEVEKWKRKHEKKTK